jgi:2,3-dihydroxyphenylpropionate 1,2-dioxygenase
MSALLHCFSHTPLIGHVDPEPSVVDAVKAEYAKAREEIARFDPELVILFSPDHYNGFFYDIMPSFCIGMAAHAIGDFGTLSGHIRVPRELAEACAAHVLEAGVDAAVSYRMQVDHGFAQPLEFLLGGLDVCPTIPVFINSVAPPLPTFRRARLLGEAIGAYAKQLGQRVLLLGSGGLSHQPPVPQLATADAHVTNRLLGSGRNLPPDEREARTQRTINAGRAFAKDQSTLHPLNPEWDCRFMDLLAAGRIAEFDAVSNDEVSRQAGRSTNEVKNWVAAFAALSAFGPYAAGTPFYRAIPWAA